jgi:hypothetical protein
MTGRLEGSSDIQLRSHATSYPGEQRLELGISAPPAEVQESLPERYNMPLLELLVVDTYFVFISWEVTKQQMAEAAEVFGAEVFTKRELVVRFQHDEPPHEIVTKCELFGETGRWFVELAQPGASILAVLGFEAGGRFFQLNTAGPLALPRDQAVEPQEFTELRVAYGLGGHGELVILGLRHRPDAPWPDITLPPEPLETVLPPAHPRTATSLHQAPGMGSGGVSGASSMQLPSSAGVQRSAEGGNVT